MTWTDGTPIPNEPDWVEEPLEDVVTGYTGLSVQERAARLGQSYEQITGQPVDSGMHKLAAAIEHLARAIESTGSTPQAPSQPPGPPPASSGPPQGYGGPPAGNGDAQVKRGKAIWARCQDNGWNVQEIGQQIVGHKLNFNSQKWDEADQAAVLTQFDEWKKAGQMK
jgi:hypothetical protein